MPIGVRSKLFFEHLSRLSYLEEFLSGAELPLIIFALTQSMLKLVKALLHQLALPIKHLRHGAEGLEIHLRSLAVFASDLQLTQSMLQLVKALLHQLALLIKHLCHGTEGLDIPLRSLAVFASDLQLTQSMLEFVIAQFHLLVIPIKHLSQGA